MVYAIVRAGGRQEKVEVGTIVVLDRIKGDKDGNIELVPVLHVDGTTITHNDHNLCTNASDSHQLTARTSVFIIEIHHMNSPLHHCTSHQRTR